jgi:hypothetical protein
MRRTKTPNADSKAGAAYSIGMIGFAAEPNLWTETTPSTSPGKDYSVFRFTTEICLEYTLGKVDAELSEACQQPFARLVVNSGHPQASGGLYVRQNIIYIHGVARRHLDGA